MAIRNRRLQTVDLIRHLVDPPTAGLSQLGDGTGAAGFVASMTDLVCPVELQAKGRNLLMDESSGLWVVFVDERAPFDRVWFARLSADLSAVADDYEVACSVGAVRPGDGSIGLDVAYRRSSLEHLGGFVSSDDWSVDLDTQARLVASGYAVRAGTRDQFRRSD